MKTIKFIALVILAGLISCDKDDKQTNNSNEIKTGDYSGLLVIRYDTIIAGGYHMLREFSLDVNNDDINDFKLSSEVWGSPGMGQHPYAKVMSLNSNSLINGNIIRDSIYYYSVTDIYTSENKTYKTFYHKYTSDKNEDPRCSFSSMGEEYFKVSYYDADEIISKSDFFLSDTINFNNYQFTEIGTPVEINDTIVNSMTTHYFAYNYLPVNTFKYIGIKISEGNNERIGWIKLGVYNTINIIVLETAIQK